MIEFLRKKLHASRFFRNGVLKSDFTQVFRFLYQGNLMVQRCALLDRSGNVIGIVTRRFLRKLLQKVHRNPHIKQRIPFARRSLLVSLFATKRHLSAA